MIDHALRTDVPVTAPLYMASMVRYSGHYGAYYWWCLRPLLHA